MSSLPFLLLVFLNLAVAVFSVDKYSRNDFPPGFVFGAATSAYQVEGAADEDGRTPSVWDTFTHKGSVQGATGDVAVDGYHKYKEDVQLMVETGLEAYRFSISWSRLIPNGRGPTNPKGLKYYNNLINELVRNGIQPHVTLYHDDLPQALEDEYNGWLSRKIVDDFTAYVDVCFREFGDRVKYWTTMNEPNILVVAAYDAGLMPPNRCSPPFGTFCSAGNSTTEPYLAAHNILLAHASSAKLYRKKYWGKQHGFIGISLYTPRYVPLTNSSEDAIATKRAYDFNFGLIVNPLMYGDYPDVMKKNAGPRLPVFTKQESEDMKGSVDFFGLIHYMTFYVKDNSKILKSEPRDFLADMAVEISVKIDNTSSIYDYEYPIMPWDLQGLLEYFKEAYGNPPIYILENGQRTLRNATLQDTSRVNYMQAYIGSVLDAIRNGSDTRGYFVWSFLDVFELTDGYISSFGLYYVDLDDPELKRQPKLSAHWYSNFLKCGSVVLDEVIQLGENLSAPLMKHSS